MFQQRKEFRKAFNSSGQLYIGGELLNFIGYDVSVGGILIEILPGLLLFDFNDFQTLLNEIDTAEIFVTDLMLTGEVAIAWVKQDNGKILLGLEFINMIHNAEKLWKKRKYYRSSRAFSGYLMNELGRFDFQGINLSVDGMAVLFEDEETKLKPGEIIRLFINRQGIKGLGKIIWLKNQTAQRFILGIRYFSTD